MMLMPVITSIKWLKPIKQNVDLGTYQPLTGQSSCDAADAGHYVDQMAQTNQTECGLGTYQSLTGQNSCDDADAGNYVELPGQTNQTACLARDI